MNTLKINRYDKKLWRESVNSEENFGSFSLEYLNHEAPLSQECQQEIEHIRMENVGESRQSLIDIYERSGRENSNIVNFEKSQDGEPENIIYFEDYGAGFKDFSKDEKFVARENMKKTQAELHRELQDSKSQTREIPFGKRIVNIGKAILGNVA